MKTRMLSFPAMVLTAFMVMAFAMGAGAPAAAQPVQELGTSGRWKAFVAGEGDKRTCFISSTPTKLEGKYNRNNRGETRVFVTHHNGGGRGEVSSLAGYKFKKGTDVTFAIDGKSHRLFSTDGRAWADDPAQDKTLIAAMKRGNRLVVTGTSSRGNKTIDTYSLAGFTKAMGMIDKACKG